MLNSTLSVVIPAHNEEERIDACLSALEAQIDDIDEIIVVDNNSTDRTPEILRSATGRITKLRVLHEPTPGIIPVRNTGFDAASGDIIARLDADTIAQPDWARKLRQFYATTGNTYAASFGSYEQYDMPFQGIQRAVLDGMARGATVTDGIAHRDYPTLMGANMAIRAEAWQAIRHKVSGRKDILEDLDVAYTLRSEGLRLAYVPGVRADVSGRRMLSAPRSYWKFTSQVPRTVLMHHGVGAQYFSAVVSVNLMRAMHLALLLPGRSYDPATRTFSPFRALKRFESRPIPDGSGHRTAPNLAEREGEVDPLLLSPTVLVAR